MTEGEWLEGGNLWAMLRWVKTGLSERKLRLFGCACCRTLQDAITPEKLHEVIELAEGYADGLKCGDERKKAWRWAWESATEAGGLAWDVAGGWAEAMHVHAQAAGLAAIALAPRGEVAKAIDGLP